MIVNSLYKGMLRYNGNTASDVATAVLLTIGGKLLS